MTFLAAGFVDGSSVKGEILRRLTFAASAGDTGVVQAGDLRVTAAGSPTGAVYIQSGTAFIATKFSDAYTSQSYVVANNAAVAVPVPTNTGSTTKVWYVIVRVTDPQYAGEPTPPDPLADDYCVPELVTSLPTTKPYVLLASLTLPAGTSAVTQAMISDRREMVNPRRKRDLRTYALRTADKTDKLDATAAAGKVWPAQGTFTVEVPNWATVMRFVATWGQVYIPRSTSTEAQLWVRVGDGRTDVIDTDYTALDTIAKTDDSRDTLTCMGEVAIPSTMRGASVVMQMRAKKTSGAATVTVDQAAALALDMEFLEAPTQDVL